MKVLKILLNIILIPYNLFIRLPFRLLYATIASRKNKIKDLKNSSKKECIYNLMKSIKEVDNIILMYKKQIMIIIFILDLVLVFIFALFYSLEINIIFKWVFLSLLGYIIIIANLVLNLMFILHNLYTNGDFDKLKEEIEQENKDNKNIKE